MASDDAAAHTDFMNVDECCVLIRDRNQAQNGNSSPQPAQRYYPRLLEGDDAGFGTRLGCVIKPGSSEASSSKSQRRVAKDDRQNTIDGSEMGTRELEANEARSRPEEAMNQTTLSKLTEAISDVNKLVSHSETSIRNDIYPTNPGDSSDSNSLATLCNDLHHARRKYTHD